MGSQETAYKKYIYKRRSPEEDACLLNPREPRDQRSSHNQNFKQTVLGLPRTGIYLGWHRVDQPIGDPHSDRLT